MVYASFASILNPNAGVRLDTVFTGTITLLLFGATLLWQRYMMKKEQKQRDKESAEKLLKKKMEAFFMAVNRVSDLLVLNLVSIGSQRSALPVEAKPAGVREAALTVQMLETYHFPFLVSMEMSPWRIIADMTTHTQTFATSLIERYRTTKELHSPLDSRDADLIKELREAIENGRGRLNAILTELPRLDLYKLSVEWKSKRENKKKG